VDRAPTAQGVVQPGLAPVAPPTPAPAPEAEDKAPPRVVRITAPPAVPDEIANEKDPIRKAELQRMHKLTIARTRAGLLNRRVEMLRRTLDEGRDRGDWPESKIRDVEAQLEEVQQEVNKAEAEALKLEQKLHVR
jgi:hypothetical protein